ncbi:CatB-related O-acetyltransferase [Shewanella xiamenensis]
MFYIVNLLKLFFSKLYWRRINSHNKTTMGRVCDMGIIRVGIESYGTLNVYTWGAPNESLDIGHYVSIASEVKFILGGNHHISGFTTYPIMSMAIKLCPELDATSKGGIKIDDDVWIGFNSIILSGVHIGRGSIVAAGSVVTKSFPPYSVIGGNPAKFIKERLSSDDIAHAEKIDFSRLNINELSEKEITAFYSKDHDFLKKYLGHNS